MEEKVINTRVVNAPEGGLDVSAYYPGSVVYYIRPNIFVENSDVAPNTFVNVIRENGALDYVGGVRKEDGGWVYWIEPEGILSEFPCASALDSINTILLAAGVVKEKVSGPTGLYQGSVMHYPRSYIALENDARGGLPRPRAITAVHMIIDDGWEYLGAMSKCGKWGEDDWYVASCRYSLWEDYPTALEAINAVLNVAGVTNGN